MPVSRPDQLPPAGQRTRSFQLSAGDVWTPEPPLSLWRASKLFVTVAGNPVFVRLSRSQPPEPPEWEPGIPVPVGSWSHAGPFGYWQFENLTSGQVAIVSGAAYAE